MIEAVPWTDDELRVMQAIERHVGREQALPLELLAAEAGVSPRVAQELVKHLIESHGQSIGSSTGDPHGYYMIQSADDLERSKAQLRHRIISTARRLAQLEKSTAPKVLGQITLDLEQERAEVPA